MPHITISMYPGRSKEIKEALANQLSKTLMETLGVGPEVVSVSIHDVKPENWGGFMDSIPEEELFINPYK